MKKWMIASLLMLTMLLCVGCGKMSESMEQVEDLPNQEEQMQEGSDKIAEEKKEDKKDQEKQKGEKKEEDTKKEETEKQSAKTDSQTQKSSTSTDESNKSNGFTSSKAYYIKVNRQMNTVTVYTKDDSGHFTVPYRAMVCSTGEATPIGTYDISYQGQWNWLGLDGGVCGQYCTQITGDYLFHSVPYTERYNKGSLQPGEYDKLGTTCSHGCIRLTVADAKWIYYNKSDIARVELYNSSDPGPLGKPYAQKIGDSAYKGWDPTDPDADNPWHNVKVQVGSYVGKTEADAKKAAQTLGLTVGSSTYQYSDKAKGTVIAQSLSSGSSVKRETKITFTVSKGPQMISVGSYVGKTEADAKKAAQTLGLTVGSSTYQYSDKAKGTVIAQSLSSGASVKKGTTITLTVSKGSQMISVGSYVGKAKSEAVNAAKAAGLSVGSIDYQYSNSAEGTVIAQSLSSGASVKMGTTITFTVSKGVAPVTVGSYTGMTISDATAQIEALGLYVSVEYQDSDTAGIVIAQNVASGTSVAVGTTITLTVSQMVTTEE